MDILLIKAEHNTMYMYIVIYEPRSLLITTSKYFYAMQSNTIHNWFVKLNNLEHT